MENVVVRFAPSPTGYLHIGGARTAIFNWLYARKHEGKFILRIEDTDAQRSDEQTVQGILESLRWLGIEWDEGPNFQSRSTSAHLAAARRLVESGHAYKCFCSRERLDRQREAARRARQTYRYDGACRCLTADQADAKVAAGLPYVIRLKVPGGEGGISFEDRVYGHIEKKYHDIEDFVLVRANGQPLYVLANAVDDIRDGITHIIRGQDGLANTPKQILIYRALGAPLPVFAHMSLTLDPQKTKISKRKHGSQVAIQHYREKGILSWAMVNFLALLGWATPQSRELFGLEELVQAFCLEGISRANSVFNISPADEKFFTDPKLLSINAHYLRTMPVEELTPLVASWLKTADLWDPAYESDRRGWFSGTVELIRSRYHVLSDFVTHGRPFFSEVYEMEAAAVSKHLLQDPAVGEWIPQLADRLEGLASFDAGTVECALRQFISEHGLKPGKMINAVRTVVTGQATGPEFINVLCCLGPERVVARLRKACAVLGTAEAG